MQLSYKAKKAVTACLTIRNWLIGYYVAEYKLQGSDRAHYGDKLLKNLSESLGKLGVSNCNKRQLYDYIKFYRTYQQIAPTVSAQFEETLPLRRSKYSFKVLATPIKNKICYNTSDQKASLTIM